VFVLLGLLCVTSVFAVIRLAVFKSYPVPGKGMMMFYTLLGLFLSGVWIWFLCQFVVDLLDIIGFTTEISSGFLGVTLLAMGNCVGDFIADVSVANLDFLEMAITGTYSSPTFNMMVGLGATLTITCLTNK
jgi:sodium/potassium/calcium exchanger 6